MLLATFKRSIDFSKILSAISDERKPCVITGSSDAISFRTNCDDGSLSVLALLKINAFSRYYCTIPFAIAVDFTKFRYMCCECDVDGTLVTLEVANYSKCLRVIVNDATTISTYGAYYFVILLH